MTDHRSASVSVDFDESVDGIEIIDDSVETMIISDELSSIISDELSSMPHTGASSSNSRTTRGKEASHRLETSEIPLGNRKHNHGTLSWRSDPNASFSDWTIEVATVENNQITCSTFYHCHSNVLVWGPRKCGVFVKLFQDRMKQTPYSTITQIQLSPSEAEAFPSMLDFLYCETTLSLSADRICSIFSLAERFENEMLTKAIQAFVENYLDFEQSIEFFHYVRRQKNREKFDKLVLLTNSKICGYLVKHPKEASKVPPEMLAHILHRRAQVMKVLKGEDPRKFSGEWEMTRSKILSTVVSECCFCAVSSATQKYTLTRQTFERLTNPKHLPALDSNAALQMLHVDSILSLNTQRDGDLKEATQHSLSSLELRCIQALVMDWSNLFAEHQDSLFQKVLPNVRSRVVTEILLQVSSQYECKIGTTGTPRHHDILENLQPNRRLANRTSRAESHWTIESAQDGAMEYRESPSIIWKEKYGVSNFSTDNYLVEQGISEEDILSPVNRYSIAPERRRF